MIFTGWIITVDEAFVYQGLGKTAQLTELRYSSRIFHAKFFDEKEDADRELSSLLVYDFDGRAFKVVEITMNVEMPIPDLSGHDFRFCATYHDLRKVVPIEKQIDDFKKALTVDCEVLLSKLEEIKSLDSKLTNQNQNSNE